MAYRVFICHSYGHRDIYFELVQKLNDANYFNWRNLSVQYDMRFGENDREIDNEELRREISKKIADCDVFLVLTKPVASRRRWLQWEVRYAKELGKPIVGIARRRNDRVSSFVKTYAEDVVDTWRINHIVNAIKIYAKEFRPPRSEFVLAPSSSLPQELPDAAIEAEPSPPAPDENYPLIDIEGATFSGQALIRGDLGQFIPGPKSEELRQPRWWWPFSQVN